jgi:hypothetical protein
MSSATINTMFGWAIVDEAIADEDITHSSATSQ